MRELPSNEASRTQRNQTNSSTKSTKGESNKLKKQEGRKLQSVGMKSEDANASATATNVSDAVTINKMLDSLQSATNINVKEKIEIARLRLESERLEVEKAKAVSDQRFWVRNFGTSITAIISLAAVLVSLSQVWVASIQKDKELAITQSQREKEIGIATSQKEKELGTTIVQQDRAWKLDMAKFVLDHGDKLLGKDKAQRELITRVMLTTFPAAYSAELIGRLEAVTDSQEVKRELQNIRATVLPRLKGNRDAEEATGSENALTETGFGIKWVF
jgi:hypothetical protein